VARAVRILSVVSVGPKTLGADGNYRGGALLATLEGEGITPHVLLQAGPIRGEDAAAAATSERQLLVTFALTFSLKDVTTGNL
jgi:hypothetical protein